MAGGYQECKEVSLKPRIY